MHSAKNTALIALMAITGFSMTASAAEPTAVSAAQTVVDDAVSTLQIESYQRAIARRRAKGVRKWRSA